MEIGSKLNNCDFLNPTEANLGRDRRTSDRTNDMADGGTVRLGNASAPVAMRDGARVRLGNGMAPAAMRDGAKVRLGNASAPTVCRK